MQVRNKDIDAAVAPLRAAGFVLRLAKRSSHVKIYDSKGRLRGVLAPATKGNPCKLANAWALVKKLLSELDTHPEF